MADLQFSLLQLQRPRVCAIVSPVFGENLASVPGKGTPVVVAPAQACANSPARPWDFSGVVFAVWQPLQVLVSPGRSCSQLRCCGKRRRPFLSSTEMRKATLDGTRTRTEPSGSIGA